MRWTSSNSAVATVDSTTGYVTAKGEGKATIKATAQDGTGKYGVLTIRPQYFCATIDYCATEVAYEIILELPSGEKCGLKEVNRALSEKSS